MSDQKDFLGIDVMSVIEAFLASPAGQKLKEELIQLVVIEVSKLLTPKS